MLTSLRLVITPRIPAGYTYHIEGAAKPVFANRKSLSVIAVTVGFELHHHLAWRRLQNTPVRIVFPEGHLIVIKRHVLRSCRL